MSWVAIISVIMQVLQAAGVFDWITKWLEGLFHKAAPTIAPLPVTMAGPDVDTSVDGLFSATRPGWLHPVKMVLHTLCWHVADRNRYALKYYAVGPGAGLPVDPATVAQVNGTERSLFGRFNANDVAENTNKETAMVHDDCKSMAEDMVDTFGDGTKAAGANAEGLFFDGTIISIIRGLKAAGASDWIKWLPVIFQLISTVGPKVAEIIKSIMDAINQNKAPKDVLSDLVIAS